MHTTGKFSLGEAMRRKQRLVILGGLSLAVALAAAQSVRKPGLWEITSTMTWQQSPFAPSEPSHNASSPAPAATTSPFGNGTHTSNVCLTQEMIDKYGAPLPQSRDCHVENLVKSADGMKADWVCTGRMFGKGTLESTRTEEDHARGHIHFAGTMVTSSGSKPVEFSIESASVFKSSDCGDVKPLPMPPDK